MDENLSTYSEKSEPFTQTQLDAAKKLINRGYILACVSFDEPEIIGTVWAVKWNSDQTRLLWHNTEKSRGEKPFLFSSYEEAKKFSQDNPLNTDYHKQYFATLSGRDKVLIISDDNIEQLPVNFYDFAGIMVAKHRALFPMWKIRAEGDFAFISPKIPPFRVFLGDYQNSWLSD